MRTARDAWARGGALMTSESESSSDTSFPNSTLQAKSESDVNGAEPQPQSGPPVVSGQAASLDEMEWEVDYF